MMKLSDIRKNPEGLLFDKQLSLKDALIARESSILDLQNVTAKGIVSYDDGLYLLHYHLSYELILPSSRSMTPVTLQEHYDVSEVFIAAQDVATKKEMVDENLVLILEDDVIDLSESVLDNILLNIPLKVLTEEEEKTEAMPEGDSWTVLTEAQYQQLREEEKQANNPFASLSGLFDDSE
ncbi:YceD family protein [Streptococcus hyovaginalis]|uniref:YceD family protein n=1 Tax=Streptococcus hyovaginalis TaxID=149015 RepID=UPI001478A7E8